ncbi:hypothetical protein [Methanosarcina sp.]|uniref:hypothetical protein n=1 Tax=Methanosarcina sp. TaxID=2213 RepID=UPI003C77BAD8
MILYFKCVSPISFTFAASASTMQPVDGQLTLMKKDIITVIITINITVNITVNRVLEAAQPKSSDTGFDEGRQTLRFRCSFLSVLLEIPILYR